jgi:uncharacterized protein YkwD
MLTTRRSDVPFGSWRRIVALVVFTGLVAALAASVTAGEAVARDGVTLTANERAVLRLIQRARANHGLAALRVCAPLQRAAVAHAREMRSRGYFSHSSYSGETYAGRFRRFGYSASGFASWRAGEVIGWGSGDRGSPRAVFASWMSSAGHRAVILDPGWRDVGVGCSTGSYRGIDGVRMYTVDFGRRTQ